jgi:hypothetical protein
MPNKKTIKLGDKMTMAKPLQLHFPRRHGGVRRENPMKIMWTISITLLLLLATQLTHAKAQSNEKCSLMSEGIYDGTWVKHRISLNDEIVYGANDMSAIVDQLGSLREQGLCR